MRAPRRGRALLAIIGAFLLICGLLLITISGDGEAEEVSLDRELAMQALDSAHRAEEAMDSRNYGEARAHLRQARRTLAGLLHQAKEEAARTED